MLFNEEQKAAIFGKEPMIVVAAGAGSGKTRVLTERYVHLCELKLNSQLGLEENSEMGAEGSEIVTLTFTEDAALEMKSRIRKRLLEKLQHASHSQKDFWKKQIESLDTAIISTFHSFCQRVIQENSFEADIFPNFQVLDDVQSKLLKAEIFSKLIQEAEEQQKWQSLMTNIQMRSLEESLFSVYGKIREYEMGGSLQDTLHIDDIVSSWRTEAKGSLEEFETDFYRFFQSKPDVTGLTNANLKLFTGIQKLFEQGLHSELLWKGLGTIIKNSVPKNLMSQNRDLYDLLQKWTEVSDFVNFQLVEHVLLDFSSILLEFDERYEQKKRESAVLDFSDLQQKAIRLMGNLAIQSYYASQYKHFLVDEMQDTNQLQLRMIEKINPKYRFIVGDGKQSIYRFRGADVQIFNGLMKQAKDNTRFAFIDMNTNYRTCDSIIKFINELFGQECLMGTAPRGEVLMYKTEYSPMSASRYDARSAQNRVEYIKVTEEQEGSQDENQYVMIARRMVQLERENVEIFDKDKGVWRPAKWRDMSVLIASRTNLATLEQALEAYEIPYNVYGGLGFYDRQEVVDYLSLLQWLNRPFESLYIMACLRSPLFGVTMEEFFDIRDARGEQGNLPAFIYERQFEKLQNSALQIKLEKFCSLYEKWAPFMWTADNRRQLLDLFEDSGLKKVLLLQKNNLMKIKNVEKLIETITSFNAVSMEEMLEKISILADLSKKEGDAEVELSGGNFVHIMTVHGSKGLEFPVVFVPNLSKDMQSDREPFRYDHEQGISVRFKAEDETDLLAEPIEVCSPNFEVVKTSSRDQAIEESKRLFYVALTRARDLLILSSKDKGRKNTWYSWLEDALKESARLGDYVQIVEGIPEQNSIQEFEEMYKGLTEKLERNIPVTFSVSEVMSYMDDCDGFLEKHILKLDEAWLEEPEIQDEWELDEKIEQEPKQSLIDPRTLGTIVHRICELLDNGYAEKDAYREAFTIVAEESELYLKSVKPLIQSYLNKEFGQPIENEWEFVLDLDGVQILGEIDKVVEKNGRLEVIDLKTNIIRDNVEELVNYYRPQLYLYKLAYEKQKQAVIDKMSLVFLRDEGPGMYEIPYEPSFEKEVLTAIHEMTVIKRDVTVI